MEDDQGEKENEKAKKRLGGLRALCRTRLFIYFCFWIVSALHTLDSLSVFSFSQAAAGKEEEAKDVDEVKEIEEEEEQAEERKGCRKRNTEGIVVGRRPRLIATQACGTITGKQCECV